jgi:hypothetical protein
LKAFKLQIFSIEILTFVNHHCASLSLSPKFAIVNIKFDLSNLEAAYLVLFSGEFPMEAKDFPLPRTVAARGIGCTCPESRSGKFESKLSGLL